MLPIIRFVLWMQLCLSGLFAATIIWAYIEFRPGVGQLLTASSETIVATANVIAETANTVEANYRVVKDAQQLMTASRKFIEALRTSLQQQSAFGPTYAEGMQAISGLLSRSANAFSTLGDGLAFSMPTRIQMDGIRPAVVYGQPLMEQAKSFKDVSADLKKTSDGIGVLANSLKNNIPEANAVAIDTANKALTLINSTEMALADLQKHTLPNATNELKRAASNLSAVNSSITSARHSAEILFAAALLIAAWCFLHSISQLHLFSTRRS